MHQAHTGSCALIQKQFYLQGCKEDFIAVHQSTWALGSKDHFVPRNDNGLHK